MLEEHFSNKKLKYSATWQRLKRAFYSWDTVHMSHQNALFLQDTSRVCLNTEATQVAVLCNDAKLLCCLYFPFGYRLMVPCRADRQNKECNLRATLKWMELMNYVFYFLSASFINAIFFRSHVFIPTNAWNLVKIDWALLFFNCWFPNWLSVFAIKYLKRYLKPHSHARIPCYQSRSVKKNKICFVQFSWTWFNGF